MDLKEFNTLHKKNASLREGIALPEYLLNEKIERATRAGASFADLFLVIPCTAEFGECEVDLETKFGKLKVFFCKELYEFQKYGRAAPQALLLNRKKYDYPKISKPSARAFTDLPSGESHLKN